MRSSVARAAVLATAIAFSCRIRRERLACGGLVTPNGTVSLLKTTTLAAYHDIEHYVTSFEFAGEGRGGRLDHPAPASRPT